MRFYFSEVDAEVSFKDVFPWLCLFVAGVGLIVLLKLM